MIASSTTMPMAIVSASSVKLLIEKPRKYMMANVATIDAGIASPGITVARRFRRNTKMINTTDRKSTRLNSSHGYISYAVFCLKKKKKKKRNSDRDKTRSGSKDSHDA